MLVTRSVDIDNLTARAELGLAENMDITARTLSHDKLTAFLLFEAVKPIKVFCTVLRRSF